MARKTYMFPWGACLGPMERMGTNSTISPSWLGHKHCESRFLNVCKSKTHQEIMKHGMVSLHGIYNCPIWAKLYYKPFTNRSLSQPSWFRQGNMPLLWAKRQSMPLLALNFVFYRQHRITGVSGWNLKLFRVHLAIVYILLITKFSMHLI